MKTSIILFLASFWSLLTYSQRKIFISGNGDIVDSTKATFYLISNKVSDTAWVVKQFGVDDTIIMSGTYKDPSMRTPNGKFLYYAKPFKGVKLLPGEPMLFLKSSGEMINGVKTGQWIDYNSKGSPAFVTTFKKDNQDGLYQSFNENGSIRVKGNFVKDKREGQWHTYTPDGDLAYAELYKNGSIINRHVTPDNINIIPPDNFKDYLENNLSKTIQNSTGVDIFVSLTISTKGKIIDVDIKDVNRIDAEIKQRLLMALKNSPLFWGPAFDNRRNALVEGTFSFGLKIEGGKVSINYAGADNTAIHN